MIKSRVFRPENLPFLLLSATLVIAGAILVALVLQSWSFYHTAKEFSNKELRMEELRGKIVHLDEVLTMSSRIAAATGEPYWEERYNAFVPELNSAIRQAVILSGEQNPEGQSAKQTEKANQSLIEMEKKAFELIHEGKREEAMKLLSSVQYEEQKRIYAVGMGRLTQMLHDKARARVNQQKTASFMVSIVLCLVLPALVISWFFLLQTLRKWKETLVSKNTQLTKLSEDMLVLNEGLDQKVKTKTIELKKVMEEAVMASRAKSEFLATMSHEIRTPMNAIIGMAEVLDDSSLTPDQKEYVEILKRNGDNLLTLINDILDLSKVESGKLELEESEFDFRDIVERVGELMALRAHQKGLELVTRIDPVIPTKLIGDPNRLRQILVNLVGNAVKFTEQGEVVIHVCSPDPEKEQLKRLPVRFTIQDTGIGIAKDQQDRLFTPFMQADSSSTRRFGGTGLGLAICKQLVELMGGYIRFDSEEGKGTTVYFTVRLQCFESQIKKTEKKPPLFQGISILIVDDNATNRLVMRQMLISEGAVVTEAPGGLEELEELIRMKERDEMFHLILLDCRMPGMDGFDFVERVRQDLSFKNVTIMMLTSDNRKGDIARAKALKLDRYLIKPVKKSDLFRAISDVLNFPEREETKPEMAAPSNASPEKSRELRILLMEDNKDNRSIIQMYLQKTPYQLDFAVNGQEGLEKVRSGKYDLLLIDLHMPVMDGYEATKAIRLWEKENPTNQKNGGGSLPILALSANALKEEIQMSLAAGCTEHLTKPIKKSELLEAISRHSVHTK